jgi:3-methyladenine DNA glycosylase AlkC
LQREPHPPAPPPRRKGARRIAEIPRAVLRALNEGREETITLVEWLAVDARLLLGHVLPDAGFPRADVAALVEHAGAVAATGITARTKSIGARLHEALAAAGARDRRRRFEALASHRSDVVRALAAYSLAADAKLDLEVRLAQARRFAADPAMSVRECAWDSYRPWLARELERGIGLLVPWVRDRDPAVRRCAIESTRPRGVWTAQLVPLVNDPRPGLVLLEPCRADPSDYVRRAVANWLNDASKSKPEWVRGVCARWSRASKSPATAWIVKRAQRTISGD